MTAIAYIIPILIFGATLFLVLAGAWYLSHLKDRRTLLRKIENEGQKRSETTDRSLKTRAQQLFMDLTRHLAPLAKPKKEDEISQLRIRFLRAGLGGFRNVLMVFYGSKVLLAILPPVLLLMLKLSIFTSMLPMNLIFLMVFFALVGFYLPDLWLRIKIADRKDQITRAFPDALDLMVVCAEAGMGLDSSIQRVGREMGTRNAPLSEELRILSRELMAGKLRRDALKNLAMRTDSEDIESFTTLLIQTDRFGTSIAQAMRVQADSMRIKRTQKVEEIAAKLPVKLLFPTIFFIFPSLFVVLMGPALVRAFRVWSGH
ncbi:MAG: Bacterial type II secretion system protein F domain protein [Syntrophorhabdus sp. PtaU1.Bin153]|nr:MAG: Bacterial type II secretion system protein F domain protein [Syntrophorhabdus sp. PtaU1.Bin153]